LDIHSKFFKLVQESFNSEQGFTAALDKVEKNNIEYFEHIDSLGLWQIY